VLSENPIPRLVVASSMSLYGEGLYRKKDGSVVPGEERTMAQLTRGEWELRDDEGEVLTPLPTPEDKRPGLASIYALSKYDQERLCLIAGKAYGTPTVALRFFNVFGTRQALSNPYTGVLAIFASRFLNDNPPLVNEDGHQRRDFVSVYDITQAICLSLEGDEARVGGQVFNVGSGSPVSILEVAERMGRVLGKAHLVPQITGQCRFGDIRHCFADITKAQTVLGYKPTVSLEEGLVELASYLEGQGSGGPRRRGARGVGEARLDHRREGIAVGTGNRCEPRNWSPLGTSRSSMCRFPRPALGRYGFG
jgi:dTDP-L-rhamnose 4-epimerase